MPHQKRASKIEKVKVRKKKEIEDSTLWTNGKSAFWDLENNVEHRKVGPEKQGRGPNL